MQPALGVREGPAIACRPMPNIPEASEGPPPTAIEPRRSIQPAVLPSVCAVPRMAEGGRGRGPGGAANGVVGHVGSCRRRDPGHHWSPSDILVPQRSRRICSLRWPIERRPVAFGGLSASRSLILLLRRQPARPLPPRCSEQFEDDPRGGGEGGCRGGQQSQEMREASRTWPIARNAPSSARRPSTPCRPSAPASSGLLRRRRRWAGREWHPSVNHVSHAWHDAPGCLASVVRPSDGPGGQRLCVAWLHYSGYAGGGLTKHSPQVPRRSTETPVKMPDAGGKARPGRPPILIISFPTSWNFPLRAGALGS
jgi:hypothetical protein